MIENKRLLNELVGLVESGSLAIAFDRDGFLVDIGHNRASMTTILTNRNVMGVAFDREEMSINFLSGERAYKKSFTPDDHEGLKFVSNQLIGISLGMLKSMKKQIDYGNKLTIALNNYLFDEGIDSHLKAVPLDDFDTENVLPVFRLLHIDENGVNLYLTAQTMFFVTNAGIVKVFDITRDVELDYIIKTLSFLFKLNPKKLTSIFVKSLS